MDKYKKIQLVSWIIVLVAFLALIVWFVLRVDGKGFNFGFRFRSFSGPYEEAGRYSVEKDDIRSINIDWVAGDITVIPYDGDAIEFIEYAQVELNEDEVLLYKTTGTTLLIKYRRNNIGIFGNLPPKKLEVFIPSDLADSLDDFIVDCVSSTVSIKSISSGIFKLDSVSGDAKLLNISSDEISLESTSGNIELKDSAGEKIYFSSVSGRISADNVMADRISAGSTSGNIKLQDVTTDSVSFETTSGDTTFDGIAKELKADSTSGDFDLSVREAPDKLTIDTVSGDVNMHMPAVDGLSVYHDSTSGDFNSDIPVIIDKKGKSKYSINTTSGDVRIEELLQ